MTKLTMFAAVAALLAAACAAPQIKPQSAAAHVPVYPYQTDFGQVLGCEDNLTSDASASRMTEASFTLCEDGEGSYKITKAPDGEIVVLMYEASYDLEGEIKSPKWALCWQPPGTPKQVLIVSTAPRHPDMCTTVKIFKTPSGRFAAYF